MRARRFQHWILTIATVGALCAGCVSSKPAHFEEQVRHWVPIGTARVDAEKIMSRHGFECQLLTKDHPFNTEKVDYLDCERDEPELHDWTVKLYLTEERVSGYGPAHVDGSSR